MGCISEYIRMWRSTESKFFPAAAFHGEFALSVKLFSDEIHSAVTNLLDMNLCLNI